MDKLTYEIKLLLIHLFSKEIELLNEYNSTKFSEDSLMQSLVECIKENYSDMSRARDYSIYCISNMEKKDFYPLMFSHLKLKFKILSEFNMPLELDYPVHEDPNGTIELICINIWRKALTSKKKREDIQHVFVRIISVC